MKLIISCGFAAAVIVIATTMLMPEKLKRPKIAIMGIYVFSMAVAANLSGIGQFAGIPMVIGLLALIIVMSEGYRMENAIMAGIGYLINMLCNNLICFGIVALFKLPLDKFTELYGEIFYIVYIILLWLLLRVLRHLLYEKMNLAGYISSVVPVIRYGMFANVALH